MMDISDCCVLLLFVVGGLLGVPAFMISGVGVYAFCNLIWAVYRKGKEDSK